MGSEMCIRDRGKDVTGRSPRTLRELGVAYIPEDRVRFGVAPGLSVEENLVLRSYYREPFSGKIMLRRLRIEEWAERLISEYRIVAPSLKSPAKLLSGGNLQRLIIARELSGRPKLIVAAHPTYGLDVASAEHVRRVLLEHRDRGAAILLVSEDLDEVLNLSDRVAVMSSGRFTGILSTGEATPEKVGLLMAGGLRSGKA